MRRDGSRRTGPATERRRVDARHGGFTLLELAILMVVVAVGVLAASSSLVGSTSLNEVNRETALAQNGARAMLETLQGSGEFESVFARFNEDAADDPLVGLSPGSGFDVPGLQPVPGDPDGRVGEITFPTAPGAAALELREDLDLPEFGLPRDLNGDGLVTPDDVRDEYRLLPVRVRLRWQGQSGVRSLEVVTLLAER